MVQLTQGPDEFRWNLHENGKISVDSMYRALILPEMSVCNKKNIWKMKIPLKEKSLHGIFRVG
jgi:hypothetical protein